MGLQALDKRQGQSTQERIWAWIMTQSTVFERDTVLEETNAEKTTLDRYLDRLTKGGFIALVAQGQRTRDRSYKLLKPCPEAPKLQHDGSPSTQGLGQEQIWRSFKMFGGEAVSLQELVMHASTPQVPVTYETARSYVNALQRAGYIKGSGPNRKRRYRFNPAMNTGPKAPQIQRISQIFDPNLGAVVWTKKGAVS